MRVPATAGFLTMTEGSDWISSATMLSSSVYGSDSCHHNNPSTSSAMLIRRLFVAGTPSRLDRDDFDAEAPCGREVADLIKHG